MLTRIPVSDVRLGMYVVRLEGAWLSHPFWKTRFVLDDPEDLRRLQHSSVAGIWIDTAQGSGVEPERPVAPPVPPGSEADRAAGLPRPEQAGHVPAAQRGGQVSQAAELREAAAICQRGRQAVMAMFHEARLGKTIDAERCLPLVEEITASVARQGHALVSLARLKTRDDYSYMHSVAVCALMVALARQLGLDDAACREAGLAGLMHDIGKALMPVSLLTKPGKLTPEEFQVVRRHPRDGHDLLREGWAATAGTLDVVLHHHERMDGQGYPEGLSGDQISQLARMGALCDVYDAITSNRPYKTGWDPAESIARMASWKGHFDPALLSAFVQSLGIYPTGSLVRLASARLAVVVEQNPGHLTMPQVKVFYSERAQMQIEPVLLDLSRPGCQDRIVGRQPRQPGQFDRLDELWADADVLRRLRVASP